MKVKRLRRSGKNRFVKEEIPSKIKRRFVLYEKIFGRSGLTHFLEKLGSNNPKASPKFRRGLKNIFVGVM